MFTLKQIKKLLGFGRRSGVFVGRGQTRDIAFQFRMGAGFVGDVNRTHPFGVEPTLIDAAAPPTLYGQAVVIDATTQGVRPLVAGDSALTDIYGITVRPFPQQQRSGGDSTPFGSGNVPPTTGAIDVLRQGYIMATLSGSTASVKGGAVFVWVAASSGSHIQGNFEAATGGGSNTIQLAGKTTFNGPADANGIVEIAFNI